MTKKSLAWQILSFLVAMIAAYSTLFGEKTQAVFGIASFTITAVLQSPVLSTGSWPKGWTIAMWATQAIGIFIQVANYLGEQSIVPAMVVNLTIVTLNTIMVVFVKQYDTAQ